MEQDVRDHLMAFKRLGHQLLHLGLGIHHDQFLPPQQGERDPLQPGQGVFRMQHRVDLHGAQVDQLQFLRLGRPREGVAGQVQHLIPDHLHMLVHGAFIQIDAGLGVLRQKC
mgnify:CR=1 FL=1